MSTVRNWFGIGLFCVLSLCASAQTVFTRPAYSAQVDAGGNLVSLKMQGVELLAKPLEFCPDVKWTLERIDRPTADEYRVLLKSERGTGEIHYRLEPDKLIVTLRHRIGGFQTWQVGLHPNVLGIENLQDTASDSAETIRYVERGDIRATPLLTLSRTQRVRLHLNNGAKVLFWHEGWGAAFNIDEMGSVQGLDYRRRLLENDKPMRVTFALNSPPKGPLQPAPVFLPKGDATANLTLTGSPTRFTLKFAEPTINRLKASPQWRVTWTLRDFFHHPASEGTTTFTTEAALGSKSVAVSLPVKTQGWYSVLFALSPVGTVSPPVAPSEYRTRFAVVDSSPVIANPPPVSGAGLSVYGYAALMGMRGMRESHRMSDFFPERNKPDWKRLDEVIDNAAVESKRWGISWFFQANEVPKWCSPADYEQLAYEMVSRCKDRCRVWEVENEPNFRMSPADYVQKSFLPFARGAKRADPNCTVIGPDCVSVPYTLNFVEEMRKANALELAGGISTHTYVGPGEPWELYGNPQYLAKLHTAAGNLPLWQTEQGYTWNLTSRDEQARYVVRQYLNAAAAGIPNERHYYFYPVHNGFEPWYLVESTGSLDADNGTLEPSGLALRVLNAQTTGRTVGKLEQPLVGVYALRFSGPKDDVLALWTLDYSITLRLKSKILQATRVDGRPISLPTQRGEVSLPIDGYALYLHLSKGAALGLTEPARFGTNFVSAQFGTALRASSELAGHPASHAMDGRWSVRDATPGIPERTWWESSVAGASPETPQWLQADFEKPRRIDRSLLLTPLPAVDGGVPRDYAVEVSDDGMHWRTVAQVKAWTGWAGLVTFPPVRTNHVRLRITALNDGWHLDGTWRFMVSQEFTRYTDMHCRVLDWMLFGPDKQ